MWPLILVLCRSLIFGLAVLALATVDAGKTVAIAKTADLLNPNLKLRQSTSVLFVFRTDKAIGISRRKFHPRSDR